MTRHLPLRASASAAVLFIASVLASGSVACSAVPGVATAPAPPPAPTQVATQVPVVPATPTPTIAPAQAASSSAGSGANPTGKRVVLGYYVPYDGTSWVSFKEQATGLDYVGAQWVTVDACGNIGSKDDRTLVSYANDHGVKVLPSLLTSTGWLNHRLLADPATTDRFVSQIVSYVTDMDYPGIDLDLEGINDEDRDAYSSLVATVANALHKRGKILTLAIPAKTTEVKTGWAGPYDYAALGKSADLILLMTYDYSWQSGPPGSIAPQQWVDKVAAYATSQMPAQKVLLGVAFYGYDWNKTQGGKARALQYSQSLALTKQYGAHIVTDPTSQSATFGYTAKVGDAVPMPPSVPALQHEITVRQPIGQCSAKEPATSTPVPKPTPTPVTPQEHVVWLEDAASVASKLQVALQRGVGGVGTWRLGQEDPSVWPQLGAFRLGK